MSSGEVLEVVSDYYPARSTIPYHCDKRGHRYAFADAGDGPAVFGILILGFLVLGGPLTNRRTAHAIEAESEEAIRATFARDPWSRTHLEIASIEPWTIRLDGRSVQPA